MSGHQCGWKEQKPQDTGCKAPRAHPFRVDPSGLSRLGASPAAPRAPVYVLLLQRQRRLSPYGRHDEIMRNSSLATAQRARSRQLQRLAAQDTEQRFFDMFPPDWYASQTACLDLMPSLH